MNTILHKIIAVVLLSFLTLFSCVNFGIKNTELKNKIGLLEFDIQTMKKKIQTIHKEIDETIIENNLANQIIVASKKEDFLLLVKFIAEDYKFIECSPDVEEPQRIEFQKQDFFELMFTKISLNINTDVEGKVYAFIEELIEKIPGYVTIKYLNAIKEEKGFLFAIELNSYTLMPKST